MKGIWKEIFLIILPLVLASYMLLRFANLPYVGPNATDQNKLSMIARNYNYFGLLETKFLPIISPYKTIPENPDIYFHHGVLMEVIAGFFMKIFGYDFWVGRIPYIIAAFLIIPILGLIAKELKNKKFAILTLFIATLIPATTVFGRMIQYEGSWTILFIVLTAFLALKYIKTNNNKFFYLGIISALLGVLCDWPLTYFSLFLLPLFFKNNKKREGLILLFSVVLTAAFLLFYINIFSPLTGDTAIAILNRSLGPDLTSISYWPVFWVLSAILRLLVYFNPLIILASAIYVFYFIKKLKQKKLDNFDLITFSFFAYGITYILLYPEGAFLHPHWIYSLVPFVSLSATEVIFPLVKKRLFWVAILIVLSTIFVLVVENWKTGQNLANLYRYNLAKNVSKYFIPFETIDVNPNSYIDFDLYNYAFLQNIKQVPAVKNADFGKAKYYVYSCICGLENNQVNILANMFKFETYSSPPGNVFMFFLKEKQDKKIPMIISKNEIKTAVKSPPESLPKKIYRLTLYYLHIPQL